MMKLRKCFLMSFASPKLSICPPVSTSAPQPVLKWAGGKRQLLGPILAKMPERIGTYYEPFVGGAAVFFALAAERRFERAVISDQNEELVNLYQVLKSDVDGLMLALRRLKHSEEDYYRIRASRPRSAAGRAARMVYLNRTGYNGLYRVNRSGEFNVPFGRYANPRICDPERLRAVSQALEGVTIVRGDFEQVSSGARAGDVVYFDPPYVPISETAKFAEYQAEAFGPEAQKRLAAHYERLTARGVKCILSNSDAPLTRSLYGDFTHEFVDARRSINSNGLRRGPVRELLVYGGRRLDSRSEEQSKLLLEASA